jgi:hypothetical protein
VDEDSGSRRSGLRLEVTFSVGYERRRAGGEVDRWEARFTTAGLFLAGVAVTLIVLIVLIPRLLSMF